MASPRTGPTGSRHRLDRFGEVTLGLAGLGEPDQVLANATTYLEAAGHLVVAWLWLEQALVAGTQTGDFYDGKRQAAAYFFRTEPAQDHADARPAGRRRPDRPGDAGRLVLSRDDERRRPAGRRRSYRRR
nr:acyl-CoA dehydrogenase C-terminal domain-containing protein [Nocardioides convexus]